jgi:hypothetical protein
MREEESIEFDIPENDQIVWTSGGLYRARLEKT